MEMDRLISELKTATATLIEKASEIRIAGASVGSVPLSSEELESLLMELLRADDMLKENFVKWPRNVSGVETAIYERDKACRDHWSEGCRRKDAAVHKLVMFAKVRLGG